MAPNQPARHFASILTDSAARSGKSLKSIIRTVKSANTDLDPYKQRYVAKTIKKLNDDPNAVVTNKMTKDVVLAVGKTGMLKQKYQNNPGAAIVHVQGMFKASNAGQNADKSKNMSADEKAKAQVVEKKKMWARAREAHQEEDVKKKGVIKSIGLGEWQSSKGSISQALKEEKEHREEELSSGVQDMVID